jgi:hypothetical protein
LLMDTDNRQMKSMGPDHSQGELETAKKIFASLLLARKNYSLYPEGHSICMNSFEQLYAHLDEYLSKYGDLRIDIEINQLVSQGEVICSAPPEEGALPFTLFRDGIRWLEFTHGIDSGELREFLRIINKYSILSDEPEGDIVTAFWETQLPHIKYEVADFAWGEEQDAEFTPPRDTNVKTEVPASLREKKLADWAPLPDPAIDQTSIIITPQDRVSIQEMVRLEEETEPSEYLDALLDSLLQNREKENFEVILDVLEEEFKGSLSRRDFTITLKIFQSLQYVLETCKAEIPWAVPLIEDFFLTASSSASLKPLHDIWSETKSDQADMIKKILMFLQPEAIHSLGTIILLNQSPQLRALLLEVITSLASRDPGPLETLISSPDDKLVQNIVQVFVNLKGERPLKVLLKLIRHRSERVRQEAVKGLLQRGNARIRDIFKLIDDKDMSIRNLILKQLGQTRDHATEGLFLDYLENRKFKKEDGEHVIACFITLGQCGSIRSIPFLRRTLLDKGWMPRFWRKAHRKGAAIALNILGIKEASMVLEDARRCLYPSVRSIIREVKKDLHK